MVRITSVLLGLALIVGLTSSVSAGSSHSKKKSSHRRNPWDSRDCDSCYEEEWEYCSETCDAYGPFDDCDYSTPSTAKCGTKYGLIGFSDSIKLHRPDVSQRYVSQLGAHFALCDDYNSQCHAAKFQLGLYEEQKKKTSHKKHSKSKKADMWKLVAQTKWLRFQDHCDEYQLFDVDSDECESFEMCAKTNYRVGMLVGAGSELTVFSHNTTKSAAWSSYQPVKNCKYGNTRKNMPYMYEMPKCDSYLALEMVLCNNPTTNSTGSNTTKY